MLPHLAGRPPTLVRAPDGAGRASVLREALPAASPEWVPTGAGSSRRRPAGLRRRRAADARVARQPRRARAAHPPVDGSTTREHPTAVVLDLDPGRAGGRRSTAAGSRSSCATCSSSSGCVAVVKTSGGKGLHLSVPLNALDGDRRRDEGVRARARAAARVARPEAGDGRHGEGRAHGARCSSTGARTTGTRRRSCAYSLRIRDRPTVSTPVSWDEVEDALDARRRATRSTFEAADVLERVDDARRPLRRQRSPCTRSCPPSSVRADGARREGRDRHRREPRRRRRDRACALAARGLPGRVRGAGDRRHAAADPGHDRRDGAPHRRRRRRGDRGADQPRAATTRSSAWSRRRSSTFGRVDILVNNAAITFPGDLELPMKRFDLVMQVDLRAPLHRDPAPCCPAMKARGEGAIVNVSSVAALNYFPGLMAYGMAKAALEHLTVVGRAPAPAVRHRGQHVPHRRAGRVRRLRRQPPRRRPLRLGAVGGRGRGHRVDARAAADLHRAQRGHGRSCATEHGIMASRASRAHHQQPSTGDRKATCARSTANAASSPRRSRSRPSCPRAPASSSSP